MYLLLIKFYVVKTDGELPVGQCRLILMVGNSMALLRMDLPPVNSLCDIQTAV